MFPNIFESFYHQRDLILKSMVKKLLTKLAPKMVDKVHRIEVKDTYRFIQVNVYSHKCKHIMNYSHSQLNSEFKQLFDEDYKKYITKEVVLLFIQYDPYN